MTAFVLANSPENHKFSLKKTNSHSNDQQITARIDEYGLDFAPDSNKVKEAWVRLNEDARIRQKCEIDSQVVSALCVESG